MLFIKATTILVLCTTITFHTEAILVKGEISQVVSDGFSVNFNFENTSDEIVFLFIPSKDYSVSTDTLLNFDISSGYITDPLSFPKYKMSVHPIYPGESYTLNRNYSGNIDLFTEVFIGFDYLYPSKATGKLHRKLRRFARRRKSGVVHLIDYHWYQDKYNTRYGKFIRC